MRIIARAEGRHGEIYVVERLASGERLYVEAGVAQSCVRHGGEPSLVYIHLMRELLGESSRVLMLGCGGGALATSLHRKGKSVTVVDCNPISFGLAQRYFWMPSTIQCVACDMGEYLRDSRNNHTAIAVDVGGPAFDYRKTLNASNCAELCARVKADGRVVINICCEWHDTVPETVAGFLERGGLDVWVYDEEAQGQHNVIILGTKKPVSKPELAALNPKNWTLRRPWEGRA